MGVLRVFCDPPSPPSEHGLTRPYSTLYESTSLHYLRFNVSLSLLTLASKLSVCLPVCQSVCL